MKNMKRQSLALSFLPTGDADAHVRDDDDDKYEEMSCHSVNLTCPSDEAMRMERSNNYKIQYFLTITLPDKDSLGILRNTMGQSLVRQELFFPQSGWLYESPRLKWLFVC